ncbi:protein translocase subunit SecF [Candidatus Peregrinibacteria bacterium]|nr:protein translocase subunit SecF [Candidatus Peregrinibacteria bacterium]
MKRFLSWKIFATIFLAVIFGFYDLPPEIQKQIAPFTPEKILNTKIQLGLDLQGGSQLDYKVDLRKVPEKDQPGLIEGVRQVIERRVNGLGISEPNIYISNIGDEKHIVVEIAKAAQILQEDADKYLKDKKSVDQLTEEEKKMVSLEKAKETVGKTIQLEFKEEKDTDKEKLSQSELDDIKANAKSALSKIKQGKAFEVIGQEEAQSAPDKVKYFITDYQPLDQVPSKIKDTLSNLKIGEITQNTVETGGTFIADDTGKTVEQTGIGIIKLLDKKEVSKDKPEVDVSHILIAYKGATGADATVTRTQDEAEKLAKEIKSKLAGGEDFTKLAKGFSNDNSNKDKGGKLDKPVTGEGTYVFDFEQAALKLSKNGELSEPTKTQFGYHIIKADSVKTNQTTIQYKYANIVYSTLPDPWKDTGLTGKHFVHADVQLDNFYQPYVQIKFNEEGAKLFEEITGKNVNKRIAIFVGGELISAPKVNEKISGGNAQINGQFTTDEAKKLAQDLNTGAIPAPIILSGEYTIGATLGKEALNQSIIAGLMGLLFVMVFMVLNYKVAGLIADGALLIYTSILMFLIKSQLHLGIAIVIALAVFFFLIAKLLSSKDSGWEKFISFVLSCFAFFFITFLIKSGVVLTLAGIAGIIISIGIAVDANVLIFARIKEELKAGKSFSSALDAGFERAWSAIRDSNFSTLLTCAILFFFGSSMIKGFAFNLAAGILVSMFTAIIITKTFLIGLIGKKITQNLKLFIGVKEDSKKLNIPFIQKAKYGYTFSGILLGITIISLIAFGLNLGTDFKGGTLLEYKFDSTITKEELATKLKDIEKEINSGTQIQPSGPKSIIEVSKTDQNDTTIKNSEGGIDLTTIKIIEAGTNGFIVKTKYLSSEDHDKVLKLMKEKLPKFTEQKFSTIGAVLSQSLLQKAIVSLLIAIVMIIAYITFSFRKIPKSLHPLRFGICAIIALIHDVTIVTGLFIILGKLFNVEIDTLFVTAILTVFGYSVNDTIVIFDRIRENILNHGKSLDDFPNIANESLNQVLVRSLNTALTTIIALIALLIWGNSSIFYFTLALTLGVAIGTYSSIFVATPILVLWNRIGKKQ